jgi:hypothetical protein
MPLLKLCRCYNKTATYACASQEVGKARPLRIIRRLLTSADAYYGYNAIGRRVEKVVGGNRTDFLYTEEEGHLLYEKDDTLGVKHYVWLEGKLLAVIMDWL